ncbi:MAG: NAD+ synthase (glutamine-hydrolysing) [Candidatus Saganbacteria bacterium]|uniref:Glutamine-dependent NAD(+) synthetase n=1 Tax=Candidatus Saganbacteria bacterium TaxID=2575572 RepID=A0A833L2D5_UNCSA|nr:MAG: NAD+ synthase (glutamine-hydrolysing) [Candidatus Saganbacteria bacterium]
MKIALAQTNPIVGDIFNNTSKIIELTNNAHIQRADIVVFPELAITGYPPEDLLLKPQFVADNIKCLKQIAACAKNIAVYVGFVDKKNKDIYNAGAFIVKGKIIRIYHKMNLPNYSVFDEKRYFKEGKSNAVVAFKGKKIGLGICEDIWVESGKPKNKLDVIINISASPYHTGKVKERKKMLSLRAKSSKASIIYVNMVGGQDELVFDGGSMALNPKGKLIAKANQFIEEMVIVDLEKQENTGWLDENSEIYNALMLGTKDYVEKNKFSDVLIGLSGGIDSALTLAIAADALGADRVHAYFMPSEFSSAQSFNDAKQTAENLGVEFKQIPISEIFAEYLNNLEPHFKGMPQNIAEENLQARIRGTLLMALSNKFNWLVLATGNKSEMSTGYCTLYGDMAGGYAVLKDIPKTLVYKLVEWRNKKSLVIGESIIKRPPTAELKPNQKDQDVLPPYDMLDVVIKEYVEKNRNAKEIANMGFKDVVVQKVISMIDNSEYKRRQAPPGPRITSRAFGKDWRLPITNRY